MPEKFSTRVVVPPSTGPLPGRTRTTVPAGATHSDAAPPSFQGQSYPPPSRVWTIRPDEWEKYHETWPVEWKQVFQQK